MHTSTYIALTYIHTYTYILIFKFTCTYSYHIYQKHILHVTNALTFLHFYNKLLTLALQNFAHSCICTSYTCMHRYTACRIFTQEIFTQNHHFLHYLQEITFFATSFKSDCGKHPHTCKHTCHKRKNQKN